MVSGLCAQLLRSEIAKMSGGEIFLVQLRPRTLWGLIDKMDHELNSHSTYAHVAMSDHDRTE